MMRNNHEIVSYVQDLSIPKPITLQTEDENSYLRGLRKISEGKCCLLLCSGLHRRLDKESPNLLYKPSWELEMNYLEATIRRLKELGKYGSIL